MQIERLLGIAIGGMGMSLADFYALTPFEFSEAYKVWMQKCEERGAWERVRFALSCLLQPYSRRRLKLSDIAHFHWDLQHKERSTRERFEEIVKLWS